MTQQIFGYNVATRIAHTIEYLSESNRHIGLAYIHIIIHSSANENYIAKRQNIPHTHTTTHHTAHSLYVSA